MPGKGGSRDSGLFDLGGIDCLPHRCLRCGRLAAVRGI